MHGWTIDDTIQREYVDHPGRANEIDDLIRKHWGSTNAGKPNKPNRWPGMDLRKHARSLGVQYEEAYVQLYYWGVGRHIPGRWRTTTLNTKPCKRFMDSLPDRRSIS